jgi:hypothetical protein
VETSLWDFVLEQGLSGREPQDEIIAQKEEVFTNTGPRSPLMREFWAALSFGKTVFPCQDGIYLEWRRRPGFDGGLGGSSWTVEQVMMLRGRHRRYQNYFHKTPGVRSYQPQRRDSEDGGSLHGDWSQGEIRDPWARLFDHDLILA